MTDFQKSLQDAPFATAEALDLSGLKDVPQCTDVLPDGREALVMGDPEGCKKYNHLQGDNTRGFQGTCGLVSCEDVLRQFGVDVNESRVVDHAVENDECAHPRWWDPSIPPAECGGTSAESQADILKDFGVPAHVDNTGSLTDLARNIAEGHGVIIEVNAGVLWDEPGFYGWGEANHAIVVTGVAVDSATGEIQGFYINDSGYPPEGDSGRFLSAEFMKEAWMDAGGQSVVTNATKW